MQVCAPLNMQRPIFYIFKQQNSPGPPSERVRVIYVFICIQIYIYILTMRLHDSPRSPTQHPALCIYMLPQSRTMIDITTVYIGLKISNMYVTIFGGRPRSIRQNYSSQHSVRFDDFSDTRALIRREFCVTKTTVTIL